MSDQLYPWPPTRFTYEDASIARELWGANCGPGAIAAITGKTLDEVRPFLGDFEQKHYTNPTLMLQILKNLGVDFTVSKNTPQKFPDFGLARIQWEGPWTQPGVPLRVRYRHTHWVASVQTGLGVQIFDINCMDYKAGWVEWALWADKVVPWLLKECVPRADGGWHITHTIEVKK